MAFAFAPAATAAAACRARSAAARRRSACGASARLPPHAPASRLTAAPRSHRSLAGSRPTVRAASSGADNEEVGISDLVQLSLGGFACSAGFVCLLLPQGAALPVAQNAVERMRGAAPQPPTGAPDALCLPLLVTRDAADAFAPTSPRALTLLQLAQRPPIDMGAAAVLPYDSLAKITGDEESLLGAAIIAMAGDDASGTAFAATLLASGSDGAPGSYDTADAWLAVALSLRYAPYGARVFATRAALAASGVPLGDLAARFPGAVSAADVAAEGAAAADSLRRAFTNIPRRPGDTPPPAV